MFCIDRGGTFTDCLHVTETGEKNTLKLLSRDLAYADAPTEGIRRLLEKATGEKVPYPVPTKNIKLIRMGTTVATNALLERKGEDCALLITKGFGELLHIGNQSRPKIFQLDIPEPYLLYKVVAEVDERLQVSWILLEF